MANLYKLSNPPLKNTAFTFDLCLFDTSGKVKTSPTLAAGDIQVSKDGGAFSNITDLPVQIGSTGVLKVSLTATEMNADRVAIKFHDAAGDEWVDLVVTFSTVQVVAVADYVYYSVPSPAKAPLGGAKRRKVYHRAFPYLYQPVMYPGSAGPLAAPAVAEPQPAEPQPIPALSFNIPLCSRWTWDHVIQKLWKGREQ